MVQKTRDEHVPRCRKAHRGVLQRPRSGDLEILGEEQQRAFEKVLPIKGTNKKSATLEAKSAAFGKKFARLYEACGKGEPETYRTLLYSFPFPPCSPFTSHVHVK